MADTQQFEGPSIEAVLSEVRRTLGADAEIIEANKVRKGGIGGFFAKETFEVTATASAATATPAAAPATAAAQPAAAPTAGAAAAGGAAPRRQPAGEAPIDLPPGIDEAAFDRAAAHVRAAGAGDRVEAGALASLLGLADTVSESEQRSGLAAGAAAAPRTRAEQVAQQVMAEHLRSTGAAVGSRDTDGAGAFEPLTTGQLPRIDISGQQPPAGGGGDRQQTRADAALPRISTEGTAFTDVLSRMATDAGPEIAAALDGRLPGQPLLPGQHEGAFAQGQADPPSTASWISARAEAMAAELAASGHGPAADTALAPEPHEIVVDRVPPTPAAPQDLEVVDGMALEQVSDRTLRLLSWLERDNLPRTTLMAALRGLPQMPALPETKGLVVAVVGERRRALQLCRQLAKACEADPAAVVLASRTYSGKALPESQRIIDVTDASRERLSWRRRSLPTFVAVECPTRLSEDAHVWTREIVDSLQAHQVIGVVTASRKVEDVRRWVEVVGGVDGLALESLEETSTPYAVLALEIPVAFLENVPASPGVWAQALMEGAPA